MTNINSLRRDFKLVMDYWAATQGFTPADIADAGQSVKEALAAGGDAALAAANFYASEAEFVRSVWSPAPDDFSVAVSVSARQVSRPAPSLVRYCA